jgi:2-polyprenyl-3-methyl-5-hydroxy-6-metoxy-1,4-benzoquinol methylase
LAAYAGAPRGDRLHVRIRGHTCPFDGVAAAVPDRGRVLDVGCGHGLFPLYLALLEPERSVTGTDVDADKLVVARMAASDAGADVDYELGHHGLPAGPWDAVTIVDVLYLLGRTRAEQLVEDAAAALSPGGSLVVKEIDLVPRWKHRLATAQEQLATRVLRITEGDEVSFLDPADLAAVMERAGLSVHRQAIDRGRLHPHHIVVGQRA